MQLYQQILVFFAVFFLILLLFFLYTQYSVNRKQITLVNSEGENIALSVEVADDIAKRSRGLMFRNYLGENEGMLFVFSKEAKHGFWMVNTTLPLDAVYIDEKGNVVEVIEMDPCRKLNIMECHVYLPEKEALYVLEVNQGFSVANKIEKGKSSMIIE